MINTKSQYDILKEICEQRKSVRQFSSRVVDTVDIAKIIELAKTSPYATSKKNWDIFYINNKSVLKQIAETVKSKTEKIALQMKPEFVDEFKNYSKYYTFFENAPVVFFLTFRVNPSLSIMMNDLDVNKIKQWERDNYTKSISCAAMLVLLAAQSLGLGACYMTGPLVFEESIKNFIQVKPGQEIGAIIPVGYAKT